MPRETGDAAAAGAVLRLPGWVAAEGGGLAPGDRLIVGNRPDALPGLMSTLAAPFRAGRGPSGSTAMCVKPGETPAGFLVELADVVGTGAAVTAVVSAAAGGVHGVPATTLAVAVSFTDVTEVAFEATAICACRLTGWFVVTTLMVHVAVPLPVAQPLLNTGFWLDGCAVRATDTSAAGPFCVETCTT